LKEELPKLYTLTKKLVESCLRNFIDLQAEWMQTWKVKTAPYTDNTARLPDDIGLYIASLQSTFNQDFAEWEARIKSLGICNGSTLAEAQNFLSPTTIWPHDDSSSSYKVRPSTMGSSRRTMSIDGEQGQYSTPLSSYRISGNPAFSPSPLLGSFPLADGLSGSTPAVRTRASSAMSSRGPSTPQSQSAQYAPGTLNSTRPSTSSETRHVGSSSGAPRVDIEAAQELEHEPNFILDQENDPNRLNHSPEERFSGLFHSALPMSDSPPPSSPQLAEDGDARILFLAASLFEFNIDGSRREAGYPYLRYVPGEVGQLDRTNSFTTR
jgi:dynamin-binding protein